MANAGENPETGATVRTAVVSQVRLCGEAIAGALSRMSDIEAFALRPGQTGAVEFGADVVLVDSTTIPRSDVAAPLSRLAPVTIFGLIADWEQIRAWRETGARGLIARGADDDAVAVVLRSVAAGRPACCPEIASFLIGSVLPTPPPDDPARQVLVVKGRKLEILELLVQGLTRKAIAQRFGTSLSTVKSQTDDLYRLLGVHTAAEARNLYRRARRLLPEFTDFPT